MNTVSILWDACLPQDFEQTSFYKVPPCGGVYFNNLYAHAGDTVSCTTSVMTGYDVFGHGVSALYNLLLDGGNTTYPKARSFPTLPMLLQGKRVFTFLVGEDSLWNALGYHWIADTKQLDGAEVGDLRKLKCNFVAELDEPFFVHLHLWSAHLRGKVGDLEVETFEDKSDSVKNLDVHLREFLVNLWQRFSRTKVLLWADHGDMTTEDGTMRHAGHLHPDVQKVWAMWLDPTEQEFKIDTSLHAQADLFRLIADTHEIEDDPNIQRYAENPLYGDRNKVWAGRWQGDRVKRYPDGLELDVDEMAASDGTFKDHLRQYGHLIPVNHSPPWSDDQWPHESVVERLKNLGYIE